MAAKVIGLTGGFGTGKTTVAGIFKSLGATVIDADRLAHSVIKRGTPVYRRVVKEFGAGILDNAGNIVRSKLARVVFNDKGELNRLNRIVHPQVIKLIKGRIERSGGYGLVVIDAPLLIEANLAGVVDKLVVVKSSRKRQIERCRRKFGMNEKDVLKRIGEQMPLEEKAALADFVIDNNGTKAETKRQAVWIWQKIVE